MIATELINWFSTVSAVILWGLAVVACCRAGQALNGTTLISAWCWSGAAALSWMSLGIFKACLPHQHLDWTDQFGYWSCVLTLCPFIAVLGSRRPTVRVWNGFIIVPLVLVLGWPAVTVMTDFPQLRPLQIQAPVLCGFAIVGVMGVGNYLGTGYGLAAVVSAAAIVPTLLPLADPAGLGHLHLWKLSLLLFPTGILLAQWQASRPVPGAAPVDRLWISFRDTFGLVWSMRILQRVNATARHEGWNCRLGMDGFVWDDGVSEQARMEMSPRIEQKLRWLMRRFVDPPWIDKRLKDDELTVKSNATKVQSPPKPPWHPKINN